MDETARADELGGDMPVQTEVPLTHEKRVRSEAPMPSEDPARTGRRWLVPLLVAMTVVFASTAVVFGYLYLGDDVSTTEVGTLLASEIPAVEDVSGQVANLLLNYNSTNLEEVAEQMLALATGNFREQYEEVLSSGAGLGSALEEASASSRGSILDGPHVYFRDATEAIALLRVTQTAQSNSNPGGTTIDYSLKITLIDTQDGGWKADRVEVTNTQQQP